MRAPHQVDRRPVLEVRHVLLGQDPADDALVAVAPGHLVADLQLALDGDVHLHHLDHARRQLVALGEAIDLVAEVLFARANDVLEVAQALLHFFAVLLERDLTPVLAGDAVDGGGVDDRSLLEQDLALVVDQFPGRGLSDDLAPDAVEEGVAENLDLLVARLLQPRALLVLDVPSSLVLLGSLAGEDAGVDDDPRHAGRHLERAVADVARLLAEDGAEQLLFG
jgi:hypothetical protein